jgi:hypothetical protein
MAVFFWSEEHARDYRRSTKDAFGLYATLGYGTKISSYFFEICYGFSL